MPRRPQPGEPRPRPQRQPDQSDWLPLVRAVQWLCVGLLGLGFLLSWLGVSAGNEVTVAGFIATFIVTVVRERLERKKNQSESPRPRPHPRPKKPQDTWQAAVIGVTLAIGTLCAFAASVVSTMAAVLILLGMVALLFLFYFLSPSIYKKTHRGHSGVVRAASGPPSCDFCREPISEGSDRTLCPNCSATYHPDCYGQCRYCTECGVELWDADVELLPTDLQGGAGAMNRARRLCPYCQTTVAEDEPMVACPECGTPHHRECWVANQGCTIYGCSAEPPG